MSERFMGRRFKAFHIASEINVSSTAHYTADVHFSERVAGVWQIRQYWYDPMMGLISKNERYFGREAPKYVTASINKVLRRRYLAGEIVFFEYDRNGDKRYDDLRYHDPVRFARSIGIMEGSDE